MSLLVIVFSEVLPKTVAITSPDTVSLRFARPVYTVVMVLGPLALAIERLVKAMLRPSGSASARTTRSSPRPRSCAARSTSSIRRAAW